MTSNNFIVTVRVRPMSQKEDLEMCSICTRVTPGEPQIWLGHEKAFTFDHVFDVSTQQQEVYDKCVRTLIDGCFEGYNATVLAYGQTGSGKTFTMGTNFDVSCPQGQEGIIPRAVEHLFNGIKQRKQEAKENGLPVPEFSISAQFIEIYNEEIKDLLCDKQQRKSVPIRIHEDSKRGIILNGVEVKKVTSAQDTLSCLKAGSLIRTTGATLMNTESSRSHAIFTLFIIQNRVNCINVNDNDTTTNQELVTLTAKFNFVDLAGSERLSRTGAVGERAREGISINSGLLHLGNVISALGDRSKKASHIPYRDSKLTRVLQDSLGGNSVTTMIACISPCDRDFVETLNTLRYANRAKNIKNKVVANQDSQTQLINELRKQLMQLELENKELRQGQHKRCNDDSDSDDEVASLQRQLESEIKKNEILNQEVVSLQKKLNDQNGGKVDEEILNSIQELTDLKLKLVEYEYLLSEYRKCANESVCNEEDLNIKGKYFSDFDEDIDDDDDEDDDESLHNEMGLNNPELQKLVEMIFNKEKEVQEAEIAQETINNITEEYERKITLFQEQIKQTEAERDALLCKLKKKDEQKRIKKEYEQKLSQYHCELEKLKRDHSKALRNVNTSKDQLKRLKNEVLEAKQQRVKLISQMKEQMQKHNKENHKHRVEINKLAREDQKKNVVIRDLEFKFRLQSSRLQRRENEIKTLRQQLKPVTERTARRLNYLQHASISGTPKNAKTKWINLENMLEGMVRQRKACEVQEKKLQRLHVQKANEIKFLHNLEKINDETGYIESVRDNLKFIESSIAETQSLIVKLQDDDIFNPSAVFQSLDSNELFYMLNKLFNRTVDLLVEAESKMSELISNFTDKQSSQVPLISFNEDDDVVETEPSSIKEEKVLPQYTTFICEQPMFSAKNNNNDFNVGDDSNITFRRGSTAHHTCENCDLCRQFH